MSVIPPVKPVARSVEPASQLSAAPNGDARDLHVKQDLSRIFADFCSKKNDIPPKLCNYLIQWSIRVHHVDPTFPAPGR